MKTDVTLPDEGKKGSAEGGPPKAGPFNDEKKPSTLASPFQAATSMYKRLKLMLYGETGVGKTTLALQFPNVVMVDMEGGIDLYSDSFKFDVLRTSTSDEAVEAVRWLLTSKHDYRTLIIDPITVLWDALQRKWSDIFLKRNKSSKGYRFEYYDFQPKDWMTIKADLKEFLRMLIALDMNVIVTARSKPIFREGSFSVASTETYDGERTLPYLFDTVLRLYVDGKGRHLAECIKDRSNKLPKEAFEPSYGLFESVFGKDLLTKKSEPKVLATTEQKATILAHAQKLGLSEEYVEKRLASYGAESLDDLTTRDADTIIKKLQATISKESKK